MSRPITNPNPSYGTQAGPIPLSNLDASFLTVYGGVNDSSNGYVNYAADIGTANNYQVTIAPVASGYSPGMTVAFLALNANTGASTLTVGAIGSIAIVDVQGNPLKIGAIISGQVSVVVYNGTSFVLTYRYQFGLDQGWTVNQNIDCSGVSSVGLSGNLAADITITLTNITNRGLPIFCSFFNVSGATRLLKIAASAPFNSSSIARFIAATGVVTVVNMVSAPISIPTGLAINLQGSTSGFFISWLGVMA
jgi:hypothetical protein